MFQVNTGFNSGQREDANTSETPQYTKGEEQPKQCRDGMFALLFYGHLAAMAWVCVNYIPSVISLSPSQFGSLKENLTSTGNFTSIPSSVLASTQFPTSRENLTSTPSVVSLSPSQFPITSTTENFTSTPSVISPSQLRSLTENFTSAETREFGDLELDNDATKGILLMVLVPAVAGFIASLCGLAMIIACAKTIIHLSLVFAILSSIAVVLIAIASGKILYSLIAVLMFVLTTCYYCAVKDRIPFAAANLNTATTAVKENLFGLLASTIFFDLLGFLYSVAWGLGSLGIFVKWGCFPESNVCETDGIRGAVIFFLLLAMFWTSQVFMNLGQVTTAGTVGSWWFNPEDS
eukprot:CAMPEP_0194300854 /NCGR_PEP_ID=MMETSP0169-20130528/61486_1 /TAXON_ID=218684 /ORGANISM="Corethron pennatum, Strain L29A3" /LENGTH=348 /DNA_ID=CAMNT_0039051065 /DNA_START=36 /DNA_END=1078 /DNA_ORIENTATION=-